MRPQARRTARWLVAAALCAVAAATAAQSLYNEATYAPLAGDRRSFKVGDLITVLVYEQASAVSSADTDASRTGAVDLRLVSPTKDQRAGVAVNSDFDGGGRTQRSGRVLAQLTVQVKAIEPTGELLVEGDQLLIINDEQQTISLQGRLRPIDVTENNTVLSSRLAGARITYNGDGTLASRQRPGVWQAVLNFLGL